MAKMWKKKKEVDGPSEPSTSAAQTEKDSSTPPQNEREEDNRNNPDEIQIDET